MQVVPQDPQDRLARLTDALVHHLGDCFAQYPESAVVLPVEDAQFARWLRRVPGFPGPLPVGVCACSALRGPLSHAVQEVHDRAGVLVVCALGDPAGADGGLRLPQHVDLVRVRRPGEIPGAVVEALAGDVPMVVDVRLSEEDGAALLDSGPPS